MDENENLTEAPEAAAELTDAANGDNGKKKKKRAGRIILIVLCSILALAIAAVVAVGASLVIKFHSKSYEYQAPVEREGEYVLPEFPQVSFVNDSASESDEDDPVDPHDAAENLPEEEKEPEETSPEVPHEALPSIINTPTTPTYPNYSPEYDRDASFSNASNAVSVYGSVPIYKVSQKDPNVRNILLVGTDTRDVTMERGRSDTMIVVSYNSSNGSVKMTSILRDTLVPIEGHDWNRLNAAYSWGGIGLCINTINQTFGLDIQEFVVIDFNGVRDFLDYIGGVDVYLTAEEAAYYNSKFNRSLSEGMNHLTRDLALAHMRNRTLGNDYGRTRRQRDVITAAMRKILTEKSVADIYDIADYTFSLVKTNISATSIASLAVSVFSQGSGLSITTENIPFSDAYQFAWYNGLDIISYDIPSTAARLSRFIYGY